MTNQDRFAAVVERVQRESSWKGDETDSAFMYGVQKVCQEILPDITAMHEALKRAERRNRDLADGAMTLAGEVNAKDAEIERLKKHASLIVDLAECRLEGLTEFGDEGGEEAEWCREVIAVFKQETGE